MDEPITVEARFDGGGGLRPSAFEWRGRRFSVASIGRQWQAGEERRILVMTPQQQTFELAFLAGQGAWRLRRAPRDFGERPTPA